MDDQIKEFIYECMYIHESFDENNPTTYAIILMRHGNDLTDYQRNFVSEKLAFLKSKEKYLSRRNLDIIDNEISRLPIHAKVDVPYCGDFLSK
jgi:hypothetical protein